MIASPLKEEKVEEETIGMTTTAMHEASSASNAKSSPGSHANLNVSFSHVQLYVDRVEDIEVYKELERSLNEYAAKQCSSEQETASASGESIDERRKLWESLTTSRETQEKTLFIPQNRDIVKQLIVGFGFRVTGYRFPDQQDNDGNDNNKANTRSLLITSRDSSGVQIIVTANATNGEEDSPSVDDHHLHFDGSNLRRFFRFHGSRQGIAVLGFHVNDIETIYKRYQRLHPSLIHTFREYEEDVKVLEVFAYYVPDNPTSFPDKQADVGTVLRFIETTKEQTNPTFCVLPGLNKLEATFDDATSVPAYCDHWVSNVFSRTEFLSTLEDTLGFTPKVDFNAGVVAAGEAQIESTVTGNESDFVTDDKNAALRDQSQVYLPINNALSEVGHVNGFLEELGQGIQHVASRVENLVAFVQRCNETREVTGEGFAFLNIPRSYYGVLTADHLITTAGISMELAESVLTICVLGRQLASMDGAVDLSLTKAGIADVLDSEICDAQRGAYQHARDAILEAILSSRYKNLYSLLRNHVSEETYMGIVRNQILVDVQGDDILYQIFTCNILQREPGDEAPFFEFIQRVCSECEGEDGCPIKIKPGCGGFGIRNFLSLFLSIELSKAMLEASEAKCRGEEKRYTYAQKRIDCFTRQLNDSNPILTEISDAMTEEGVCKQQMELAECHGDSKAAASWKKKIEAAGERKQAGNAKLMECSARFETLMRSLREAAE